MRPHVLHCSDAKPSLIEMANLASLTRSQTEYIQHYACAQALETRTRAAPIALRFIEASWAQPTSRHPESSSCPGVQPGPRVTVESRVYSHEVGSENHCVNSTVIKVATWFFQLIFFCLLFL